MKKMKSKTSRVLRGGDWNYLAPFQRAADRHTNRHYYLSHYIVAVGARLVRGKR